MTSSASPFQSEDNSCICLIPSLIFITSSSWKKLMVIKSAISFLFFCLMSCFHFFYSSSIFGSLLFSLQNCSVSLDSALFYSNKFKHGYPFHYLHQNLILLVKCCDHITRIVMGFSYKLISSIQCNLSLNLLIFQ